MKIAEMKISIYSRKSIEELLRGNFPQNAAVISFYDPPGKFRDEEYKPVDYSTKTNCVFQVALHDIDLEVLPKYHLTYETYFQEADDLAEFIFTAKKAGKDIICQCEYGESRSSGCAAAIHEYFYKDGIKIFADYRYYPNQMVYHKVYDALTYEADINNKKLWTRKSMNMKNKDILRKKQKKEPRNMLQFPIQANTN